ncbi:methylamine utilization protein MauJ [Ensifer adhaerens]|uniref:methylamine utilization protein MauJ n=1 Tax=Ensifer adhaerens TaxID=106592 RepID=UPI001C4E1AA4|nr:methylamine utilization protein MauJ [Ensifer adhaerens]MBW0369539.1 hypothetical protein [Ensifer adhaerens]UCM21348.1 hypothetical protein LDL63_07170 [Ensifer adhaerens]
MAAKAVLFGTLSATTTGKPGCERQFMRCVAHFEVISEVSVVSDHRILTINDPRGAFVARIKNIQRFEFTTPFLLSLHVYFDAPTLNDAKDIAEDRLAVCLNMLAFTTGSRFRKHRIRQIADAEVRPNGAIRDMLMWGDSIEYDDPQPYLDDVNANTIERLLEFDVPPAIRRALRWYRLGIDAATPDDQFTYFWFALEIVAEFQKPVAKVNDKCPHCQSALYCEKCDTHPQHRPYAKQAIRALMTAADENCDDATVALLNMTRNSLMHGSTLREIEDALPDPHESVVDTLGRILWNALVRQFPQEIFKQPLVMGVPSTYVHYKTTGVAHIQTVVPVDSEGYLDLDLKGVTMAMQSFGPPQSAFPSVVRMTHEQSDRLRKLSYGEGGHQEMLVRIRQQYREKEGHIFALVLSTDMAAILSALENGEGGAWQDLFREFIDTAETVR